jgi:hypothetical protein
MHFPLGVVNDYWPGIRNVAGYKLLQILHHNGDYLHWKIGALFVNFNLIVSCQHIQESLLAIDLV